MTLGFIEELDDKEKVRKEEYNEMGEICNPYGKLQVVEKKGLKENYGKSLIQANRLYV